MNKILNYLFIIITGWCLSGCQQDYFDKETIPSVGTPIIFGANISEIVSSRGLPQKGSITEGSLYLNYNKKNGRNDVGIVEFHDGLGMAYKLVDGNKELLTWEDIGVSDVSKQTYNFYLDNLSVPDTLKSGYLTLPEGHPYRFCKYNPDATDQEGNELPPADLIQGAVIEIRKSHAVNVDLSHRMASFTLRIAVYNEGLSDAIPEKAWITNVWNEAHTFNRMSGYIETYKAGTNIYDQPPVRLADSDDSIYQCWTETKDEEAGITYYDSPMYLIPSHYFMSSYWPRLYIELKDGTRYTAIFPRYMTMDNGLGTFIPRLTEFLSGFRLSLSVSITNDNVPLVFNPCYSYPWVPKGLQNITGNQASLSDEEAFKILFETYKMASDDAEKNNDDKYEFYRWGYLDEAKNEWVFNIFQNQSFKESDLKNKMPEDPALPYSFSMHYATVEIRLDTGKKLSLTNYNGGGEKLKDFLNKGLIETGVYSGDDLSLLANSYTENPEDNFGQWGTVVTEKWVFPLYQDIELTTADFAKIMMENEDFPYDFDFKGHSATVTLNNKKKLVLTDDNNGPDKLKDLLDKGIEPS